jgi:L-iditol 2-dehydrogenase
MLIEDPVTILSFYIDGGYSQYMKIPETLIRCGAALRVPAEVSDEAAALVEPAACALESIYSTPHAVGVDADGRHLYRAGIQAGGDTAIIGSGTVSLIYARLAKLEGARTVYVLVRSQDKAELVRRLLREEAVAVNIGGCSEQQIVERMAELTGGRLLDDVVAACSDPAAQRLMLELYAPDGYAVGACFGGVRERIDCANLDLHHYRMAKTIGSSGCSTRTMEAVLRRLAKGCLSLDGFAGSRRWTLDDAPAEFLTARDGGLKPMLRPWG